MSALGGGRAPALREVLEGIGDVAVAVSGGVDSVALMAFAHAVAPNRVVAFHAVSAAVPGESTVRVRELARDYGWRLEVIDAGEVEDDAYLANPVDRCFVCKSHLYDAVRSRTSAQIVSGTNVDDLDDYRPGLRAAAARGVRHPFVEAGLKKIDVRALARELGLAEVAELPAQPCLSSRVETGTRITPAMLSAIHDVENLVRLKVGAAATVRCRVRADRVDIELDASALAILRDDDRAEISKQAERLSNVVTFTRYKMGSAFLRVL